MKHPRPPALLKLAACALAGAVLTVAVARLCAEQDARSQDVTARSRLQWPRAVPASWPRHPERLETMSCFGWRSQLWWSGSTGSGSFEVFRAQIGIPFRAISFERTVSRPTTGATVETHNACELPWLLILPIVPRWPGFALDTLFYATLVFLLWSTPALIRRHTRKRRGHCPTCGYDLRGSVRSVRPECGT